MEFFFSQPFQHLAFCAGVVEDWGAMKRALSAVSDVCKSGAIIDTIEFSYRWNALLGMGDRGGVVKKLHTPVFLGVIIKPIQIYVVIVYFRQLTILAPN